MPPNQVFAAVGACIYCGSTDSPLSDEHIIPFGLNGNLILPKASCKTCATITGEIERFCLRPMLGDFRSTTGLRTRRKKTRPKTISVRHRDVRRGVEISEDIQTENYPRIALGYCFPPPGILYNGNPNAPIEAELMSGVLLSELDPIHKPGTELILKLGTFNALTFHADACKDWPRLRSRDARKGRFHTPAARSHSGQKQHGSLASRSRS